MGAGRSIAEAARRTHQEPINQTPLVSARRTSRASNTQHPVAVPQSHIARTHALVVPVREQAAVLARAGMGMAGMKAVAEWAARPRPSRARANLRMVAAVPVCRLGLYVLSKKVALGWGLCVCVCVRVLRRTAGFGPRILMMMR